MSQNSPETKLQVVPSLFIFLYFPEISILLHHFPEMRKNILKDDVI